MIHGKYFKECAFTSEQSFIFLSRLVGRPGSYLYVFESYRMEEVRFSSAPQANHFVTTQGAMCFPDVKVFQKHLISMLCILKKYTLISMSN